MDNNNLHQDFFDKVKNFVTSPIDDLIQNVNNKQQGVLIFNELETGFKEFQDILSHVKVDTIMTLPEFKINELKKRLTPLFSNVESIQNLQKNPQQDDHQQKQQIVQTFSNPYNPNSPQNSGFFAREKNPVWEIIVQSIALSNNKDKKDQEAKTILKRIKEIEQNAASSSDNLGKILTSAKSELSKSGVEVHSEIFREQAGTHGDNAKDWRKYSIILLRSTFAIRTSSRYNQKLQKSMAAPTLKNEKKIKHENTTLCIVYSTLRDATSPHTDRYPATSYGMGE